MIELNDIEHHIQKHIISVLMHQKYARFRDLRPDNTDTNLFSYHLKLLQKRHFVTKDEAGYTLDKKGILYVDRVSTSTLKVRTQPKIILMLVVQNSDGDLLLYRRVRQPYTGQWTLPYGKLHIDDETLEQAARREAFEKLGIQEAHSVTHAGDCYIRIKDDSEAVMSTLAHIFRFEADDIIISERLMWIDPRKLHRFELAPAVEKIISRTFFRDTYFFEEFTEAW